MKPTEILTSVLAIYAAALSTINSVVAIRAKRWRLVVTFSIGSRQGRQSVSYRAVNLGERSVALKEFSIETLYENKNFFRNILDALNIIKALHRIRITDEMIFSEAFVIECEPPLPLELDPGRACEMTIDQGRLLESFFSTTVASVRGVFTDERGTSYRSPAARVDWQSRRVDFL